MRDSGVPLPVITTVPENENIFELLNGQFIEPLMKHFFDERSRPVAVVIALFAILLVTGFQLFLSESTISIPQSTFDEMKNQLALSQSAYEDIKNKWSALSQESKLTIDSISGDLISSRAENIILKNQLQVSSNDDDRVARQVSNLNKEIRSCNSMIDECNAEKDKVAAQLIHVLKNTQKDSETSIKTSNMIYDAVYKSLEFELKEMATEKSSLIERISIYREAQRQAEINLDTCKLFIQVFQNPSDFVDDKHYPSGDQVDKLEIINCWFDNFFKVESREVCRVPEENLLRCPFISSLHFASEIKLRPEWIQFQRTSKGSRERQLLLNSYSTLFQHTVGSMGCPTTYGIEFLMLLED